MPDRVRITDVSPRDGLQNEPGFIPTRDKARLVELLCATGVDEVEVTSFVSPKWVPQLADGAELLDCLLHPLPEGGGGGVGSSAPFPRWFSPARQRGTLHRAQALRRATTGPEDELWKFLSNKQLGVKFRRQHPLGPYILDYFCQEKLLAVKVDGRTHFDARSREHDAERDGWVASQGVMTFRVSNDEVLRNAEEVARRIKHVLDSRPSAGARQPTPLPPPSGRGNTRPVILSALVPNDHGLQAVLNVNKMAERRLLSKLSLFTAASETFARKNINASIAESFDRFRPVFFGAHAQGLPVRAYISCAIACPFEGSIAPAKVVDVARRLIDLGADEIDLGDTIGAGTRETVSALLAAYDRAFPIPHAQVPVTLHLHDTFGRAAECVRAALGAGVRSFDGSVAGLGGCPYAGTPGKRAPGNISTELLVRTIHAAGFTTSVDLEKLDTAAAFAQEIVAKARASASSCQGGVP